VAGATILPTRTHVNLRPVSVKGVKIPAAAAAAAKVESRPLLKRALGTPSRHAQTRSRSLADRACLDHGFRRDRVIMQGRLNRRSCPRLWKTRSLTCRTRRFLGGVGRDAGWSIGARSSSEAIRSWSPPSAPHHIPRPGS